MLTPARYTESPAIIARKRLEALHAEQAAASLTGLNANRSYTADLADDIAAAEAACVGAAVTEIASLRATLDAPLEG
jgi:uncharacterized MnhB-related membrane protein